MEVIKKKTTKHIKLLVLVHSMVLSCLKRNILFKAVHLPDLCNTRADASLCLQVDKVKSLAKYAAAKLTSVPPHLLPENWPI